VNERIRELAEQAVKAVDNPFPGNPLNDELAKMYIPDCFAEKFAELIVRQCVKSTIALQNTAIDNEWHLDETFHIIVDDMVEQFDMQHIFRS
jgi:hypothetical protein